MSFHPSICLFCFLSSFLFFVGKTAIQQVLYVCCSTVSPCCPFFRTPCHLISQKIRLLVCSFCQNVHRVQQKGRQRESGRQIGRIMTHTHMRAHTHAHHTCRMVPLNLCVFSKLASAFSIFFRDDKLLCDCSPFPSYFFSADFE